MSTEEYLKTLSYEQLLHAKNKASELMKLKKEEPKIGIWRVVDDAMAHGNFLNYELAVECFIQEAHEAYDMGFPHKTLSIVKEFIIESEVKDYIK